MITGRNDDAILPMLKKIKDSKIESQAKIKDQEITEEIATLLMLGLKPTELKLPKGEGGETHRELLQHVEKIKIDLAIIMILIQRFISPKKSALERIADYKKLCEAPDKKMIYTISDRINYYTKHLVSLYTIQHHLKKEYEKLCTEYKAEEETLKNKIDVLFHYCNYDFTQFKQTRNKLTQEALKNKYYKFSADFYDLLCSCEGGYKQAVKDLDSLKFIIKESELIATDTPSSTHINQSSRSSTGSIITKITITPSVPSSPPQSAVSALYQPPSSQEIHSSDRSVVESTETDDFITRSKDKDDESPAAKDKEKTSGEESGCCDPRCLTL